MERNAKHSTVRTSIFDDDRFTYAVDQRVMTVDSFPGVITARQSGPMPGTESYTVQLDDGMGGGEYRIGDITPIDDQIAATARRYSDVPLVCDKCGCTATTSMSGGKDGHTMLCPECQAARKTGARANLPLASPGTVVTAADDYPELDDILWTRPDHVEAMPTGVRSLGSKVATQADGKPEPTGTAGATWDWSTGTPVWTQDHAGLVRDALLDWKGSADQLRRYIGYVQAGEPYPDSGNGKRWYAQAQALIEEMKSNARPTPTLYRGDSRDPTGSDWMSWSESKVIARKWAKMNGGQVWVLSAGAAKGLRIADYETGSGLDESEKEWVVASPRNLTTTATTIKDTIDDPNSSWLYRHVTGPAIDRMNDALPGTYQVNDITQVRGDLNWCRFRRDSNCFFPKALDEQATRVAGYDVWIPENRGHCNRHLAVAQKECQISEPGPKSGEANWKPDATKRWDQGGQRVSVRTAGVDSVRGAQLQPGDVIAVAHSVFDNADIDDGLSMVPPSSSTPVPYSGRITHYKGSPLTSPYTVTVDWATVVSVEKGARSSVAVTLVDGRTFNVSSNSAGRKMSSVRKNALSQEGLISVAENVMENFGLTGRTFHQAEGHVDDPVYQAGMQPLRDYVMDVVGGWVNVHVSNYMLDREHAQAMLTGTGTMYVRESTSEMTVLHECAHLIARTDHSAQGHDDRFVSVLRDLYGKHLGSAALAKFDDIYGAIKTGSQDAHTGAWTNVRDKGVDIRRNGGVHIIANTGNTVTAEVHGEHNIYVTTITRVPGSKEQGLWQCSCPWSTYAWGRSEPWKSLEGRQCSHAYALLMEMQAQEMFGGTIEESRDTPSWRTTEPVMSSLTPDAALLSLGNIADSLVIASGRMEDDDGRQRVEEALGAARTAAAWITRTGSRQSSRREGRTFPAKVRGRITQVDVTPAGVVADGEHVSADEVLYPTWDPTAGLAYFGARHAAAQFEPGGKYMVTFTYPDGRTSEEAVDVYETGDHSPRALQAWLMRRKTKGDATVAIERVASSKTATDYDEIDAMWNANYWSGQADVARRQEQAHQRLYDMKGQEVTVVKGRKIPIGTNGIVFYVGEGQWGWRVGFKDSAGNEQWTDATNVKLSSELSSAASLRVAGLAVTAADDVVDLPTTGFDFAGLIIKSIDSGRVLLTQRSPFHGDDEKSFGKWEFPGGHLDDGEAPFEGAVREFAEETGLSLPENWEVRGFNESGKYLAIVIAVPNEAWTVDAKLLDFETMGIGWFDLDDVDGASFVRAEVQSTDFEMVREAATGPIGPGPLPLGMRICPDCGGEGYLLIEPLGDGNVGDTDTCNLCAGRGYIRDTRPSVPEVDFERRHIEGELAPEAILHDEPQPALPEAYGTNEPFVPGDPRLSHLAPAAGEGGGNEDIAAAAQAILKSALKTFSPAEQQSIIDEGSHMSLGASNTDRLDLAGTFYETLEHEDDPIGFW